MTIAEAREKWGSNLRDTTLALLIHDGQVLLGCKQKKIGADLWNAPGGKVEPGETIAQGMVRESRQEAGYIPKTWRLAAVIEFYPLGQDFNQRCHIFTVENWEIDPEYREDKNDEMKNLTWFPISDIPWGSMWPNDQLWMPTVLAGKTIQAAFINGEDKQVIDREIIIL